MVIILGALATCSLIMVYQILAKVSEKFGSVLKMSPHYKWFYVAEIFAGIAALAHLMQASTFLTQDTETIAARSLYLQANTLEFSIIFHHIPLAISVTIGLAISWKYWGWLITDRYR